MKELRVLVIKEERRPHEDEVFEAFSFAREKHCIVELRWFIPHYGWKSYLIEEENDIQTALTDLVEGYGK